MTAHDTVIHRACHVGNLKLFTGVMELVLRCGSLFTIGTLEIVQDGRDGLECLYRLDLVIHLLLNLGGRPLDRWALLLVESWAQFWLQHLDFIEDIRACIGS